MKDHSVLFTEMEMDCQGKTFFGYPGAYDLNFLLFQKFILMFSGAYFGDPAND